MADLFRSWTPAADAALRTAIEYYVATKADSVATLPERADAYAKFCKAMEGVISKPADGQVG